MLFHQKRTFEHESKKTRFKIKGIQIKKLVCYAKQAGKKRLK